MAASRLIGSGGLGAGSRAAALGALVAAQHQSGGASRAVALGWLGDAGRVAVARLRQSGSVGPRVAELLWPGNGPWVAELRWLGGGGPWVAARWWPSGGPQVAGRWWLGGSRGRATVAERR
jgi:hypothetical protein